MADAAYARVPEPAPTPAAPIACFRCHAQPLMLRLVAITVAKVTRQEWACPPCDREGWWR